MQETTNLAARLKEQIRKENAIIQDQTQKQLSTMHSELNAILQHELHTIKVAIKSQSSTISWAVFRSRILWPTLIGLSLSLGLFTGSWAAMHYFTNQIIELQHNIQTLENNGGKIQFSTCGGRRCAKIDQTAATYQNGYRILEGY